MKYMPLIDRETPYRLFLGRDTGGYLHWHGEMELLICLSGSMVLTTEEQEYHLKEGDAILLPGYVAHSAASNCKNTWRVAIVFGYGLLRGEYAAVQNTFLWIPADRIGVPEALSKPLDALKAIFSTGQPLPQTDHWRIQAQLLLFCAALREHVPAQKPSHDLQNRIRRFEIIYDTLEYVAKNYATKITVEQMADLCGYAQSYFSKQFKKITGVSFYRYLTCYRISVACTLLEDPRYNLSNIAKMTGFSTQPLFCRAFKEVTSMTPKQFQALPQEEKVITWIN